MKFALKTRITLWYVLLFALIVGGWSVFVVTIVRADLYADIDRALAQRATQIAVGLGTPGSSKFADVTEPTLLRVPRAEATAQLLSAQGSLLAYSGDAISRRPLVKRSTLETVQRAGSAHIESVKTTGETFRILIVGQPKSSNFIVVGQSTETTDNTMLRLVLVMLFTGPLALAAAALGGWLLARRALRPVVRMAETAACIGIDRLGDRVPQPAGNDELSVLAATLNGMLSRLESDVEDKRRFVNDASHELQTPLAIMRAELDVSLSSTTLPPEAVEVLESAREEADRMSRIVRNLLALGRFDEGTLRLLTKPVDLSEVARSAALSLEALARERSVTLEVTGGASSVLGDSEYLALVAVNLIENAIKYSHQGDKVGILTKHEDDVAMLVVSDAGVGIPAESLEHLFDRFYRVETSRSEGTGGTGLGLAISQEIMLAHGGTIKVMSEPDVGSTFTASFPSA
ncbi:MAG: hypothetical protein CVT67_02175 [Actinobacteria bacterium HGW-Actinobacteria-7]|nr:MAG: hypothetical protein CVT67_02175 [Actinobacteria bacterium HGW-Actinobacteria-7]